MARRFQPGSDIPIFQGGEDGFGDSIGRGRRSYHWAYNMDMRVSGGMYPALSEDTLVTVRGPVTAAFEWEDTNGQPLIIFATGEGPGTANIYHLQDNAFTVAAIAQDRFTGGVLFRYDKDATTDPDEEMAWFCNGASNDVLVRVKKDKTVSQVGHTVKADSLWVVGGDLWKVGVTGEANSGYKVQKWTVDTDPGLEASWGAAIPVGRPTYPVNAIVNLGGSPIVLKGDGVFQYNPAPSVAEFENILPVTPHPDNGKGGFTDGRGRIYYPTVDGHIIVISPGFSSQQTPVKTTYIDRDTPSGRITAMTADLDHVYAATDQGQVLTNAGLGLTVLSDDGGVFTDHTTALTDQKHNTVANWGALTTGDFIFIGADEPFLLAYIFLYARRSVDATSVSTLTRSNGAGGWAAGTSSLDSTLVFLRDGALVLQTLATGPELSSGWGKNTVNGISKYWIRVAPNTALTGVQAKEVMITPYRPPIDPDLFRWTQYVLGGAFPHILVGTWQGEEIIWQDQWLVESTSIDYLLVARNQLDNLASARVLYAFPGWRGVHAWPIGPTAMPARTPWPRLASGWPSQVPHVVAYSGVDFGAPATVERAVLEADYLQSDDEVWLYWHWDKADRWEREGPFAKAPISFRPSGKGTVLYTALAFVDGSRSPMAPVFREVSIPGDGWEYSEDYGERGEDAASPQTI